MILKVLRNIWLKQIAIDSLKSHFLVLEIIANSKVVCGVYIVIFSGEKSCVLDVESYVEVACWEEVIVFFEVWFVALIFKNNNLIIANKPRNINFCFHPFFN